MAIGLIGLMYGAQGVTQTAQRAMAQVWDVSKLEAPGFFLGSLVLSPDCRLSEERSW